MMEVVTFISNYKFGLILCAVKVCNSTLPFNTEPEEKKVVGNIVPTQDEKNQIKELKILIAEDDETSEKLISKTVNKLSKEVIKARTGNAAVEICRNNPDIDLILMDIQMPDLNGYEAARQIRQFNKDELLSLIQKYFKK